MKNWILAIVLLAGGAWGLQRWQPWKTLLQGSEPLADRPREAVVETRSIQFSVSAAGDIGPKEQVSVRPEVNGRIAELPVDIGDTVKKDAPLFTLDDRDLQIEKESQDKEAERARLQLAQAQRNYQRAQQLFDEKLISLEVFEDTRTQYELAKNALERTEKSLELVRDRLRKTRILAPFNCTVLTRPVSVGQAVSGSGGFNSGTEVLTIADLHEMLINAHINQADVTRLKAGQQVEVEVEAVPGLKVVGTVERVAPQATIKNNIKGFAARILLKDVDRRIRPGMTANIKIPIASADDVVATPLAAVFTETNPETGDIERYVYRKNGLEFIRQPVRIGVADFFFAEVQEGLKAGDLVALEVPQSEIDKAAEASATNGVAARAAGSTAASTNRPAPARRSTST